MENNLVTILKITKPQLGSFVKNKFEEEGIECFFTNEGLTLGSEYNPDEVLLKVKANQSEKAVNTLLQIQKDYDFNNIGDDNSFKNLKKILVPINLINNCIDICKYAMLLAKDTNAEVKLLYVYPDPNFNEPVKHTSSWQKHVKMELMEAHKNAQFKLIEFNDELKSQIPKTLFDSVKLHYRMLKGTPQNVISDACERYQPNIILMETRKNIKKSGGFLEKTIVKVIEKSNHPVLAVPVSATFSRLKKINVMYATNFYDEDNSSLNKLLGILQAFEKEIHCVHIDLQNNPLYKEKADELNKILKKEYAEHNIKCELFESENMITGFKDFVKKNHIDIISFSKRKRSAFYKMFHNSLLEKLVSKGGDIPVLIFPV